MEHAKLFFGNLSFQVTDRDLIALVSPLGNITEFKLFQEKGFAFIAFETAAQAELVQKKLNKTEFLGRPLFIDVARPQAPKNRHHDGDRRPHQGGRAPQDRDHRPRSDYPQWERSDRADGHQRPENYDREHHHADRRHTGRSQHTNGTRDRADRHQDTRDDSGNAPRRGHGEGR